jgi:hypothetical protein
MLGAAATAGQLAGRGLQQQQKSVLGA